jgi:hypothetical protein
MTMKRTAGVTEVKSAAPKPAGQVIVERKGLTEIPAAASPQTTSKVSTQSQFITFGKTEAPKPVPKPTVSTDPPKK